ncbi:MAG: hypothetical protein ACLPKB_20610 [Xanthobacteraceae bacterium]
MRQLSIACSHDDPATCVQPSSRAWLLVDVTMTLLVIGLTTIFVRMLAWSLI